MCADDVTIRWPSFPAVESPLTTPRLRRLLCDRYVYKRLRFLGSRYASQFLTLMFLAVWHGYHLGYFVLFFMEFIIILWERKVSNETVDGR